MANNKTKPDKHHPFRMRNKMGYDAQQARLRREETRRMGNDGIDGEPVGKISSSDDSEFDSNLSDGEGEGDFDTMESFQSVMMAHRDE